MAGAGSHDPGHHPPHQLSMIGNFWADLTRSYAVHPAAAGVHPGSGARLTGRRADFQPLPEPLSLLQPTTRFERQHRDCIRCLPVGPAASQIAIKQLRHQRRRLLQRQLGPPL